MGLGMPLSADATVHTLAPITVQGAQGMDYGYYEFDAGGFNWVPDEDWSDPGGSDAPAPESPAACDELNQRMEELDCANKPSPQPNGCGAAGSWMNGFIPQGPPLLNYISFEDACNNHDKCYGAIASERRQCDDVFESDMEEECQNSYRQMDTVCGLLHENSYDKQLCITQQMDLCIAGANGFRTAVGYGGEAPFVAAQQGAVCRDIKRLKQRAGCP